MKINFWLNGAKKEAEISPDTMLLEFLAKPWLLQCKKRL